MRADQESVKTGGAELHEIVVGAQTGFADGDAVVGNAADQFERSIYINGQRLQIAIVYTQDARPGGEGAIEFFAGVNFDERLHSNLAAKYDEVAKKRIFESGYDEEKTVGVVGASFPNLPGIEDKILAQNRELDGLAGIAEIFQRAAEKFSFREHGKRASPRGFQGLTQRHRFEWIANYAA